MSAPELTLDRPGWADHHEHDAWEWDVEGGYFATVHEGVRGTVGGAYVSLIREDRATPRGEVSPGPVLVHVSETPDPLSPDGAAELGRLILVAAAEARRLQGQP